MARPLRSLRQGRTLIRRRHRTWMAAMVLASAGWGIWWVHQAWHLLAPQDAPPLLFAARLGAIFGAFGLVACLWAYRSKLAWLLLLAVPVLANASLVALPILLSWKGAQPPSTSAPQEPPSQPSERSR